jgi:hypothetical protein
LSGSIADFDEQLSVVDIANLLLCIGGMDLPTYASKTGIKPAAFQAMLAEHGLNVSREIVRRWLLGKQPPGVKTLNAIEAATGGKVKRSHLRPEIFGRAA